MQTYSTNRSRYYSHQSPENRFWKHIEKKENCWIWRGVKRYPILCITKNKGVSATRFSWELHYGKIPEGYFVCHKCDNPPCIKPTHLFLGKPIDNTRDCISKGRWKIGEKHPLSILNNSNIYEIRKMRENKIPFKKIASKFRVKVCTIESIIYKKSWKHIS